MEEQIREVAQLCHEANAAYCRSIGDFSQPSWTEAPDWQKQSAISGVKFHFATPLAPASASHENWLKDKLADGWVWGPKKDPAMKEHPCICSFDSLPIEQQIKDHIFRAVVHAYSATFGGHH